MAKSGLGALVFLAVTGDYNIIILPKSPFEDRRRQMMGVPVGCQV